MVERMGGEIIDSFPDSELEVNHPNEDLHQVLTT